MIDPTSEQIRGSGVAENRQKDVFVSLIGERIRRSDLDRFVGTGLIRGEFFQRELGASILELSARQALREYLEFLCDLDPTKEVWYRTSDLWADEANVLRGTVGQRYEVNPLVGLRGASRSLGIPDEFKAECEVLAAVAAEHPNMRVMFPFVADEHMFAEIAAQARTNGVSCQLGSMLEVPSAILRVPQLIELGATRLTIGLNDLSCLVTGSSRSHGDEAKLHPALWELIDNAVMLAREAGVPIGFAGAISATVLERVRGSGADFVSLHYNVCRSRLGLESEPWPDEGLQDKIKQRTRRAIAAAKAEARLDA